MPATIWLGGWMDGSAVVVGRGFIGALKHSCNNACQGSEFFITLMLDWDDPSSPPPPAHPPLLNSFPLLLILNHKLVGTLYWKKAIINRTATVTWCVGGTPAARDTRLWEVTRFFSFWVKKLCLLKAGHKVFYFQVLSRGRRNSEGCKLYLAVIECNWTIEQYRCAEMKSPCFSSWSKLHSNSVEQWWSAAHPGKGIFWIVFWHHLTKWHIQHIHNTSFWADFSWSCRTKRTLIFFYSASRYWLL